MNRPTWLFTLLNLKRIYLNKTKESTENTPNSKLESKKTNPFKFGIPSASGIFSSGGAGNRKRFVRGVFLIASATTLYFMFGHDGTTHYIVDSLSGTCDGSTAEVKLTTNKAGKTASTEIVIKQEDFYTATSERLSSTSAQEAVYKITVKSQAGWVSFNVTKSSITGDATKDCHRERYKLGNNASICSCSCGTGDSSTCTCKDGNCCGADSTCSCAGKGQCCCCCFGKLINYAILNPQNPNRITASSVMFSLLPTLLYLSVFIFIFKNTMRAQGMGFSGQNSIFKIGSSLSKEVKSKLTFKDVAGIKEEKEELIEIVDFLKSPGKYMDMGARVPRGVILYGPPGTGKTLLAKAVSGEAGVPFIEASGASFDDMFVGVGAKRVRELFAKAKKAAPCIIFIDEIDALAGKRGNKSVHGGGGLGDQTINQLLSELDGFNTGLGIVVIAATNRLDSIDDAVLRPGRFDRHIQVNLPDVKERIDILKLHSVNKNLSSRAKLDEVARKTPGFSGAQLENVLNEATLLSVRRGGNIITPSDIDEAIDRVMAGPAKRFRVVSEDERSQIAHHEAGHAIAGLYLQHGEQVEKITIVPRGRAAGYVLSAPKKQESTIRRKDEILSIVATTLAGRAAEEVMFGVHKVSSGASNDFYKVTNMVRDMVTKLGMSSLGIVQYIPSEGVENPYRHDYSAEVAKKIDDEVRQIVDQQYEVAKNIILEHKAEFLILVETLLLMETISKAEIDYVHEHKEIPKEAQKLKHLKNDKS